MKQHEETAAKDRSRMMMPLGLLNHGEKAEVVEVCGATSENQCSPGGNVKLACSQNCRIGDMGLRAGKIVEMLNNGGRGALLIRIDEARIAIGRGMSMKVMVRRKE